MTNRYIHNLSFAQGWIELGDATEALRELNRIPSRAHNLEVLQLRYLAFALGEQWIEAAMVAEVASSLYSTNPNPGLWKAEAIFKRTGSAASACAFLRETAARFPNVPAVEEAIRFYSEMGVTPRFEWLQG
jgi:hypothetical protein